MSLRGVPVPDWAPPVPIVPCRQAVAGRRRQRQPRPDPCFWDGSAHITMSEVASSSGLPSGSSLSLVSPTGPTPDLPTSTPTDVALSEVVPSLGVTPASAEHTAVSTPSRPARERSRSRDV